MKRMAIVAAGTSSADGSHACRALVSIGEQKKQGRKSPLLFSEI
jgi:hypothetical protein